METVAPFKEIIDAIKASGGDAFKSCYQCGLCDTVCPWNRVRTFSMRKLVRRGDLRPDRNRKRRHLALHDLRKMPAALPAGT